jgi:hypothetical protein
MWDVRNRIIGRVLSFAADSSRAQQIASGFEQLDVHGVDASSEYNWAAARAAAPGRRDAAFALATELHRLAAYNAGVNYA